MNDSHTQIRFSDRKSEIDLYQIQQLLNVSAFWAKGRSIEDLGIAIANSDPVITVWDGKRLIGFARATSDGIYRATIWDVAIDPEFRGVGLGSKLVETVLSHPRMNRVERVYLMTTHKQRFYERIGFQANSTTTMVLYNQPNFSSLPAEIQLQESLGG
ncbi:GCN5-related N-acetyltransferase [Scytonema sp. HK-05]|uniref:GNAT family N-acetyltransferase n=1 Tax=Scytonema sp. HK-05 TaxID=1137095 RepID=UPI000935F1A4|nr:GNAT family N-acetyltransferase [Scytonema sp. HK-05]OKH56669.1 GNAT family N-acetyltransferase [Scytonema sp. HK-05]BAY45579.1 GCN5-related N-acetyltransferase [Scytonema sp. HK-05]